MLSFLLQALASVILLRGSSLTSLYLGALLFGIATGGTDELFALLIGQFYGAESFGKIYGFLFISPAVAGTIGPIVAGLIFDLTHNYTAFLGGIALAFIVGIALTASIKSPYRTKKS